MDGSPVQHGVNVIAETLGMKTKGRTCRRIGGLPELLPAVLFLSFYLWKLTFHVVASHSLRATFLLSFFVLVIWSQCGQPQRQLANIMQLAGY